MDSFPRVSIRPTAKLLYAAALLVMLTPIPSLDALSPSERIDFGKHDIPSVFHIAKSQNRNQVHYGIHLTYIYVKLGSLLCVGLMRCLSPR